MKSNLGRRLSAMVSSVLLAAAATILGFSIDSENHAEWLDIICGKFIQIHCEFHRRQISGRFVIDGRSPPKNTIAFHRLISEKTSELALPAHNPALHWIPLMQMEVGEDEWMQLPLDTTFGDKGFVFHAVEIKFPYWLAILILVPIPVIHVISHRRERYARRHGKCPACGYDLRASHFKCPECGRPISVQSDGGCR